MAFQGEQQAEQVACTLDARAYEKPTKAENDTLKAENADTCVIEQMAIAEAIDTLEAIWAFCTGDPIHLNCT